MRRRLVVLSPEARDDLLAIHDRIAEAVSPGTASGYLDRIEAYLRGLDLGAERGTRRDDIWPHLRIAGFEHRITIAFAVEEDRVVVLRLFSAGRHWETAFDSE